MWQFATVTVAGAVLEFQRKMSTNFPFNPAQNADTKVQARSLGLSARAVKFKAPLAGFVSRL